MSDSSSSGDILEQVFLQYLQELDRGETSGVEEFLKSRDLSSEETRQLRALIETEQVVQAMAGPTVEEEHQALPTASHVEGPQVEDKSEETQLFHQQPPSPETMNVPIQITRLGDYELTEELGRGGMGVVYKAHQVEMDREVAFKMIRSGCLASDEDVQRFYFEARAAGKLKHPAIVQVHQVGEIDGHHYFTMEYIEGDTLSQYAEREDLTYTQIATLMIELAEAVDFAHQHGVLHRDLKPSNVLVDNQGKPRITDFGLAKDMTSGEQLTSSGSTLGTPSYMPPEQAQALRDEITCRSDVYSLGAILYAVLAGCPPFKGDSLVETLTQVIHTEPVPPRDHDSQCPLDLEAICLKCLQKSSSERYATAGELAADLQRFLRGDSVLARRSHWYDRAWRWLRNVPMIAAMLGRKSPNATQAHVRFQWGSLLLLVLLTVGLLLSPRIIEESRFSVVDFSTGGQDGSYHAIGTSLAESLHSRTDRDVPVHLSAGAGESRHRVLTGESDVAILQENALDSEDLKVVAPLYKEAILVILRKEIPATALKDLKGRKIALGTPDSGMRLSSRQLLRHYGLSEDDFPRDSIDRSYQELISEETNERLDGAIVTLKLDNPNLHRLLDHPESQPSRFRILNFPDADDLPGFRSMQIGPNDLPGSIIPEPGLLSPATLAVLAVREATPRRYVFDILEALYSEGGVIDQHQDIYPLKEAAEWIDLNYHEAARRYFSDARQTPSPPP